MSRLDSFEKYHFHETKEFDVSLIRLDPAVRKICEQNVCGHYGKNHMCPPAIKDIDAWEKEIFSYTTASILTKVYPTKGGYDVKAWMAAMADFQKTLHALKDDMEKQFPDRPFLLLGAGACCFCEACTYSDGKPCRFPDKAFPSLEACGIDVMGLSQSVGVKYNNGKNTVTYIAAILT